jgi:hypothetical protein
MAGNLTDQQVGAALADMIYRFNALDQPIDLADIGSEGSVTDFKLDETPNGLTPVDNFYYDNNTGFVGRVVQANGKIFVVFRGLDLAGSVFDATASVLRSDPTKVDANDSDIADAWGTAQITESRPRPVAASRLLAGDGSSASRAMWTKGNGLRGEIIVSLKQTHTTSSRSIIYSECAGRPARNSGCKSHTVKV